MIVGPEAFAKAAEELVGTAFRLHGRHVATGLDCVGLVAEAYRRAGGSGEIPRGYCLRNLSIARFLPLAEGAGFRPVDDAMEPGDLLCARPGPGQFHLMIAGRDGSLIHAHAGLGRVVRSPARLAWPLARHWRLISKEGIPTWQP